MFRFFEVVEMKRALFTVLTLAGAIVFGWTYDPPAHPALSESELQKRAAHMFPGWPPDHPG